MKPIMLLRPLLLIISVCLLTQCTKVTTDIPRRENQPLASPYTMPAKAYLALAQRQSGVEKQALLIMAAGRFIYSGEWHQGVAILSQLHDLPQDLGDEKQILLAKVALMRDRPHEAITLLSSIHHVTALPIYYQAQYHDRLAFAYQSVGHSTEAVLERIKLDRLLLNDTAKANNRRALWLSLTTLPAAELNTIGLEAPNGSILKGWIGLALISRLNDDDSERMLMNIERWQQDYPDHPAQYILPTPLYRVRPYLFSTPRHIALLLPLSGPLSGPGGAVRDGFMAALSGSKYADYTKVRTYDTATATVTDLYQQAINEGAQYVVGPLTKSDVAAVARIAHPVPTLLLNDADVSTEPNAYQFGLSPNNEARQVAVRARNSGYTRALVIAPTGAWGEDIIRAFTDQWQTQDGRIVDTFRYESNDDLNASIRSFLRISDSEAREKQLKRILGQNIEATPQRRQDFDMIFLVAYPSKARQIMPLLKYYYAGDRPVYAISSVYGGSLNVMKDRDLNGIIFCDMPWVFAHHLPNRNWPEQWNSYNRLYALGMDSYALSTQLNQLLLFPALGVSDHSGILYLGANQRIARMLSFGQFQAGNVVKIN